ncbi:MAG: CHRD domain-containing protein [Thermoproteota archaeon]|nr:CHRD domain-containing protein [Thermoproteota archaeon]
MNNKISSILVITLAVAITAGIAGISFNSNSAVFAVTAVKYTAKLSGQNEVPIVNTTATGVSEFKMLSKSVGFSVNATGIQGVTGGHIHLGKPGQNGPVVATLISSPVATNKVAVSGKIVASALEGPLKGKKLTDLVSAMKKGNAYVNIHTVKHPNGEIRGDITSSTSTTAMKHSTTAMKHSTTPKTSSSKKTSTSLGY